jgi:hypothetical protein
VYVVILLMPLCVAFNVIKRDAVTPVLEIVKLTALLPAGTITPAGNDSDLYEPLSATAVPPAGAGPVNITVPVSVVVPATVATDVDTDCKPVGTGANTAGSSTAFAFAIAGIITPAIIIDIPSRADIRT